MYGTISFNNGLKSPSADLRTFDVAQGRRLRQAACDRCRTSRVKCHRRKGSSECDRCYNLGKSCSYLDSKGNKQAQGQSHPTSSSTRRRQGSDLAHNRDNPLQPTPSPSPASTSNDGGHEQECPASPADSSTSAQSLSDTSNPIMDDCSSMDLDFQWQNTLDQLNIGGASWGSLGVDTSSNATSTHDLDFFSGSNAIATTCTVEPTKTTLPTYKTNDVETSRPDLNRQQTIRALQENHIRDKSQDMPSPVLSDHLLDMTMFNMDGFPVQDDSSAHHCSCLRKLTSNLHMLQSSTKTTPACLPNPSIGSVDIDQYLVLYKDSMSKLCAVEACECLQSWDLALLVLMNVDHLAKIQLDISSRTASSGHAVTTHTQQNLSGGLDNDSRLAISVGSFRLEDLADQHRIVCQLLLLRVQGLQTYCVRLHARLMQFGLEDLSNSLNDVGEALKNGISLITP